MNTDILFFFDGQPRLLEIYEALEKRMLAQISNVQLRIQKTQISFYNRHMFACVSMRKLRGYAEKCLIVTFGLAYRKESERIFATVEACKNRWTHHVVLASVEEIDGELLVWLGEAAEFSAGK